MTGVIEDVLTGRYGPPLVLQSGSTSECRWNTGAQRLECILLKSQSPDDRLRKEFETLERIYGDANGGFLLGDCLKVAILDGPAVFGLYKIEELQGQPEVKHANEIDPQVCFFMDSANIWFYGLKGGELFVYDSATKELDGLGPAYEAIERLLIECEES